MSDQHTQGRMTVYKDNADSWPLLMIGDPAASRIVANVNTEAGVDTSKAPSIAFKKMPAEANARRLAACWNACEGVPTEVLEAQHGGGLPWHVADQIDQRIQRDELAFQLLAASNYIDALGGDSKSYRAAIAKATGSPT